MKISLYAFLWSVCVSRVLAASSLLKTAELKTSSGVIEDVSSFEWVKEPLTISLELTAKPAQVSVFLQAEDKEIVFPMVLKSSKYELTLPVSKVPKFFKKQDSIAVGLITGDFDTKLNSVVAHLFDIKVSEALKNKTKYVPSLRYGALPEIHHIFRDAEKFVNPIVPVVFIGGIIVLLLGLFKFWADLGIKTTAVDTTGLAFGITLLAYEFIFIRYYISDSIFTTIARVAVLTPISVFAGSRVLRNLRQRRQSSAKKDL